MTTRQIEIALAWRFNFRTNIIVPNVSWGLMLHECDMLVVTPSNYAYEIEIKISKGDLKADLLKKHHHISDKIRALYFCIPEKLKDCVDLIPKEAGIIICSEGNFLYELRKPIKRKSVRITESERLHLLHLGCMRIWGLKRKIEKLRTANV